MISDTVEEDSEIAIVSPTESEDDEVSPVLVTVGVVVASSGILSLLVALIATNESWRIHCNKCWTLVPWIGWEN